MKKTLFQKAVQYEQEGRLKSVSLGDFRLFCYSKETFFDKAGWDEITKSHRGRLYYKGVPVNKPIPKIFNLDEQPETSRELVLQKMEQQPYEVFDKSNGHLFIVSCFIDDEGEQQVMFHTKAGLPSKDNIFLNTDIDLFLAMHGNQLARICSVFPVATYMFEAIVEHDKHTLYEEQCEEYGIENNGFILLDANVMIGETEEKLEWLNLKYDELTQISDMLGCLIIKKYKNETLDPNLMNWFEHKNIEGYVIKFKDESRVKIKTKDYWTLRFKNDLNAERVIGMFNTAGFDRLHLRLPEEVAFQLEAVITEFFDYWLTDIYLKTEELTQYIESESFDRKAIATNKDLTTQQKSYIFAVRDEKENLDYTRSKHIRTDFVKELFANKDLMTQLQERIESVVDNLV